ncbi:MAG: TonB family protein [SAR324 cluster bacterium]|nr:TonB family protein [SAR324 cluster bacterium]
MSRLLINGDPDSIQHFSSNKFLWGALLLSMLFHVWLTTFEFPTKETLPPTATQSIQLVLKTPHPSHPVAKVPENSTLVPVAPQEVSPQPTIKEDIPVAPTVEQITPLEPVVKKRPTIAPIVKKEMTKKTVEVNRVIKTPPPPRKEKKKIIAALPSKSVDPPRTDPLPQEMIEQAKILKSSAVVPPARETEEKSARHNQSVEIVQKTDPSIWKNEAKALLQQYLSQLDLFPYYPKRAIRRNMEGTAEIKLIFSTQGKLEEIALSQNSPYVLLDKAALRLVHDHREEIEKSLLSLQWESMDLDYSVITPIVFRLAQ